MNTSGINLLPVRAARRRSAVGACALDLAVCGYAALAADCCAVCAGALGAESDVTSAALEKVIRRLMISRASQPRCAPNSMNRRIGLALPAPSAISRIGVVLARSVHVWTATSCSAR